MPLENLEEEGLEKNPNLELAQTKFLLSLPEHKDDPHLKTKLLDAIKSDSEFAFFFSFFHLISRCIISR
jgi:26S proteasome regulatory subunit N7